MTKLPTLLTSFLKKTYVQKALLEVGIYSSESNIFFLQNQRFSDVISNNQFCELLTIGTWEEHKRLLLRYWMPKLHYAPFRSRSVIASS